MASKRTVVKRITARVFGHGPGGGNPVTIFASASSLSPPTQQKLAKECDWESVMVATQPKGGRPEMSFYMPSGEQVSFCAHAALGGAFAVQTKSIEDFQFSATMTGESHTVRFPSETTEDSTNDQACLAISDAVFEEAKVSHSPTLQRLLRSHLGISPSALASLGGRVYPSFVNSSIARPKTLVYLNSLQAVHTTKPPKVPSAASTDSTSQKGASTTTYHRGSFAAACKAIDDSTGIYVYTNKTDDDEEAWECRQFPRASGYAEDPATGIAAAALVGSLVKDGIFRPLYKIYQGTAMGRPSLIEVRDFRLDGDKASFLLQGKVQIDSRENIQVEDEC